MDEFGAATPASGQLSVGEMLLAHGIGRRGFIKFCTAAASAMALPPWMGAAMAEQLRSGELSADAAATLVEECAVLAGEASVELERRARVEESAGAQGSLL